MATSLPADSAFTGASVTEAQYKTAKAQELAYLRGLLGSDGVAATARAQLGIPAPVTSYSNPGGSGDRTGTIAVTASAGLLIAGVASNLVDGSTANGATNSTEFGANLPASGHYLLFDFGIGAQKIIDEATWIQSGAQAHGVWQWQGSDDGVSFTNLGASFTLGGATTQVQTIDNLNSYRYYRLLGVSGNTSINPFLNEITFKIASSPADGLATDPLAYQFPDWFPTSKLISAYFFDDTDGVTVHDRYRLFRPVDNYDIDLTLPTNPNVTRTAQGLKLVAGLIQTPSLPGVAGETILYRTDMGGSSGFLVSGVPGSGNGTMQEFVDPAETISYASAGLSMHRPASVAGGSVARELNRGGWGLLHREHVAATSPIGLGGRHSTTTSRCAAFECNCAFMWHAALTASELDAVYMFVRERAKLRQIYLHSDDTPVQEDTYLVVGESTAEGRSTITSLSAADQAADMRKTLINASTGAADKLGFDKLELGYNQQATQPSIHFGPEFGIAFQRRATFGALGVRARILQRGVGSTVISPSSVNGLSASMSWNPSELVSGGLFWSSFFTTVRALQEMLSEGVGIRNNTINVAFLIGLNDAVSTAYVGNATTYQGYLQSFLDTLTAQLPGITINMHIFRPHTSDPASNATAIADVRTAVDAFAAANANVTSHSTDTYGLEADSVHYDAAGSKAIGIIAHG